MKACLPWIKVFLMGYVSTLFAHQGLLALMHAQGWVPNAAYSLAPTSPFGIPAVVSLAFFGGLWALPMWALLKHHPGARRFVGALLFGAVFPTAVALLVVFPLKGLPVAPISWVIGGLLNGAWGLGVAVLMWLFNTGPDAASDVSSG